MKRTIKPKTCRVCKHKFTPFRPLQVVCSPLCASNLAKVKEKEKQDREDKIKYTDMRIRAKSKEYVQLLQDEINKLARAIDSYFQFRCIDCGADYGNQADGSHFHNVGTHPSVRWNLHNVHKSTSHCNQFHGGKKRGYVQGLIERYGQEYMDMVDELPKTYPITKLSNQEIYDKLAVVRKLNREVGKMRFYSGIQARDILNKMIGIYLT